MWKKPLLVLALLLPLTACRVTLVGTPESLLPASDDLLFEQWTPTGDALACLTTFGPDCPGTSEDACAKLRKFCESLDPSRCRDADERRLLQDVCNIFHHPFAQFLCQLLNRIRGVVGGVCSADRRVATQVLDLRVDAAVVESFSATLERVVMKDGWATARHRLMARGPCPDAGTVLDVNERILAFQEAYFRAYFSDGRFVKFTIDLTSLKDLLVAEYRKHVPYATWEKFKQAEEKIVRQVVKALLPRLEEEEFEKIRACLKDKDPKACEGVTIHTLGSIDRSGLRTRNGTTIVFPEIALRFDPLDPAATKLPEISVREVGSQMARVFLEALGDALFGVPGLSDSTGATCNLLPIFTPIPKKVDTTEYGKIDAMAGRAEAGARALVSRVIRGLGWGALNNETVADLVTTVIAVAIRKLTEKVMWCRYACERPGGTGGGEAYAPTLGRFVPLRIRFVREASAP